MSSSNDDEILVELPDTTPEATVQHIRIRFTTGQTVTVMLPPKESNTTVAQFKQMIKQAVTPEYDNYHVVQNKYLRLIYQGKILNDHTPLRALHPKHDDVMHCTLSERASPNESAALAREDQEPLSPSIMNSNYNTPTTSNIEDDGPRGFNRLRESGFSEEDIALIRNQFYSTRQHLLAQVQQGTLTRAQLHTMEEQWMNEDANRAPTQEDGNDSGATLTQHERRSFSVEDDDDDDDYSMLTTSSDGNNYHMLFGITLGFVLGFFMVLWLFIQSVPRKFKYGILAGIGCNISFALVKFFLPPATA